MKSRYFFNQGQAIFIVIIFLVLIATVIIGGFVGPVVREAAAARTLLNNKQNFYLAEAGMEEVVFRIKTGQTVGGSETVAIGDGSVTTVTTTYFNQKTVVATGNLNNGVRRVTTQLGITGGASFNFGVQADKGGFEMINNAEIHGNLYANGPVIGTSGNWIRGDVISAGPNGLVRGFHATGSVYAHNIDDMIVDKNTYSYESPTNSTIAGNQNTNMPDQATTTLPISDEMIEEWKAEAAAGGVTNCTGTTTIASDNIIIGPRRYTCNVLISGNQNVDIYLGGNIWVEGDVTIQQGLHLRIHSSVGDRSVAVIADNEADPLTSSQIRIANNGNYYGNGPDSYIMLLSQNRSAEQGGDRVAIDMNNNATGAILLYAGHGLISISNNGNLRQLTAYKIRINNNAIVKYETGLASVLFSAGPGGAWEISDWSETE